MSPAFPDPSSLSAFAGLMLVLVATGLLYLAGHSPAARSFRDWGLACLIAAAGLALRALAVLPGIAEPDLLCAVSDLIVGSSFVMQARALAGQSRAGERLVRAAVLFNIAHLLALTQFLWFDPNPWMRNAATQLICAMGLAVGAALVWRPHRRETASFNWLVCATWAFGALLLVANGSLALIYESTDPGGFSGIAGMVGLASLVLLPCARIAHFCRQLSTQLAQSALLDPLTQMQNRRGLSQAWAVLEARARRGDDGWHVGVVLFDVDGLRKVNDLHGQGAGDTVLQLAAEAMQQTARRYDTVCRFGGDEFCMLLPGVTIRQAQVVTERIRQRFQQLVKERTGIDATLSAGVTVSDAGTSTVERATDVADQMLYSAKRDGRDRSRIDPDAVRVISGLKPLEATGKQDQFGFPLV